MLHSCLILQDHAFTCVFSEFVSFRSFEVDCTANSEICERFGVNGYPTLKIFRNGEDAGSYDGPRTAG